MPHRLFVLVLIQVRFQHRPVQPEVLRQKFRQMRLQTVVRYHQFHAVAGREDHRLFHPGLPEQSARRLRQRLFGNGQPLAQLHRRGGVVQTCDQKSHFSPNLCAEE
jgi:hypothetical protein